MPAVDYAKYLDYQHDCKRGGWKGLNFLLDEGIGSDDRFWRLAQALSALYPRRHRRKALGGWRPGA